MGIFKIRKVSTFLVGIMMMAILLCGSSQVQAAQDGDYTHTVNDGKAQITGYTGAGGNVTIPSTLGGVPVTSIGFCAFADCEGLTSISLPQGITSIGGEAFRGCWRLNSINIPQEVTSIGDGAFADCTSITSISLSQGVTSIGYASFVGCTGLTTIRFNSATTTIYDHAVTIPATTKIIGYDPSTAKTYAAKYKKTFEVIGSTNTLQRIDLTTPATKLSYTVGDTLDITGLVVTGTYSDGSTKAESITTANITGFNSSVAATDQVLTITVGAKTTTYKVDIVAVQDTTGMTEIITTSPIVLPSKVWTIKLSGLVNESSLNGKVYVTNAEGIKQQTTCTATTVNGLSQIEVKPDNNYAPGDYMLWVKNITSTKGIGIKKQVYLRFTIQ